VSDYDRAQHDQFVEAQRAEFDIDERQLPKPYHLPGWYMGGHGDPVASFDARPAIILLLHPDGTVTWESKA